MSESINLKNIEKKAFRSTYQDGLWDIYMGGVVLCMALLAGSLDSDPFPFLRFGLFIVGLLAFQLLYQVGKKFLTAPRMGQVKFGPQRQRRARTMKLVLGGIVLLQVLFLAGSVLLWKNPGWAASLGLTIASRDLERLVVAAIGALFVGPSTSLIAYFNDFPRGYYIAALLSLAVFSMIWFGKPFYMVVAALLIMLPGVVLLVRFLRQHPLPPAEVRNG